MALTVQNLIDDLIALTNVNPQTHVDERENFYNAIQAALDLIDSERTWSWSLTTGTFPTVASTASYDLSTVLMTVGMTTSNYGKAVGVFLADPDRRLLPTTYEEYVTKLIFDSSSGYAERYVIQGDNLLLWPTPTSVYTVTVMYARHHGDIRRGPTIYVPTKFRQLIAYLARQCFKGEVDTLDKMIHSDPYIALWWQKMIQNERPTDSMWRRGPGTRPGHPWSGRIEVTAP